MHPLEMLVSGLGLVVGCLAGWLWSNLSARLGDNRFWQQLQDVGRTLLSTDGENQFFEQYMRLLPLLVKFVARKLVVLVLAFAPVVIALAVMTPFATRVWDERVTHVEVAPAQTASVEVAGLRLYLDETDNKIPNSVNLSASAKLSTEAGEFRCENLMQKQAFSTCLLQRLTLSMLGWRLLEPATSPASDTAPPILLRPSSGDDNVFWPYLSDWEFAFLIAVTVGSIVCMLVLKVRKR